MDEDTHQKMIEVLETVVLHFRGTGKLRSSDNFPTAKSKIINIPVVRDRHKAGQYRTVEAVTDAVDHAAAAALCCGSPPGTIEELLRFYDKLMVLRNLPERARSVEEWRFLRRCYLTIWILSFKNPGKPSRAAYNFRWPVQWYWSHDSSDPDWPPWYSAVVSKPLCFYTIAVDVANGGIATMDYFMAEMNAAFDNCINVWSRGSVCRFVNLSEKSARELVADANHMKKMLPRSFARMCGGAGAVPPADSEEEPEEEKDGGGGSGGGGGGGNDAGGDGANGGGNGGGGGGGGRGRRRPRGGYANGGGRASPGGAASRGVGGTPSGGSGGLGASADSGRSRYSSYYSLHGRRDLTRLGGVALRKEFCGRRVERPAFFPGGEVSTSRGVVREYFPTQRKFLVEWEVDRPADAVVGDGEEEGSTLIEYMTEEALRALALVGEKAKQDEMDLAKRLRTEIDSSKQHIARQKQKAELLAAKCDVLQELKHKVEKRLYGYDDDAAVDVTADPGLQSLLDGDIMGDSSSDGEDSDAEGGGSLKIRDSQGGGAGENQGGGASGGGGSSGGGGGGVGGADGRDASGNSAGKEASTAGLAAQAERPSGSSSTILVEKASSVSGGSCGVSEASMFSGVRGGQVPAAAF